MRFSEPSPPPPLPRHSPTPLNSNWVVFFLPPVIIMCWMLHLYFFPALQCRCFCESKIKNKVSGSWWLQCRFWRQSPLCEGVRADNINLTDWRLQSQRFLRCGAVAAHCSATVSGRQTSATQQRQRCDDRCACVEQRPVLASGAQPLAWLVSARGHQTFCHFKQNIHHIFC